jgi:hypothetical protein
LQKKQIKWERFQLGFVTGLPSVLAATHGAQAVHMHSWDDSAGQLECYVKPTLRRNSVSAGRCKFTVGDYGFLIFFCG